MKLVFVALLLLTLLANVFVNAISTEEQEGIRALEFSGNGLD